MTTVSRSSRRVGITRPAPGARLALALLAIAVPTHAVAQRVTLVADVAADPTHVGPPAWRYVREQVLPHLAEVRVVDPTVALRITLTDDGHVAVTAGRLADTNDYAHLALHVGEDCWARGTLAFDGTEVWTTTAPDGGGRVPALVQRLVARFGFEVTTGWLELDVATAIGNLMIGHDDGDPVGALLTLGALECGDATLTIRPATSERDAPITVVGKSGGGLALPAVMLSLADHQAARAPDLAAPTENLERWLLLAASARASELEEAARQLSRFDDPRAVHALERLLHEDGLVRLVAMHGLARLHATDSIGAIAAAVDPNVEGSVEVGARAITALLPRDVADALATRLAPSRSNDAAAVPAVESDAAPRTEPLRSTPPSWTWAALAAACAVGIALGRVTRQTPA